MRFLIPAFLMTVLVTGCASYSELQTLDIQRNFEFQLTGCADTTPVALEAELPSTVEVSLKSIPEVDIEARFIRMNHNMVKHIFKDGVYVSKVLSVPTVQAKRTLEGLNGRDDVELVCALDIHALSGAVTHLTSKDRVSYVQGFNIKASEWCLLGEPKVDTIENGIHLALKPTAEEESVSLELNLMHAETVTPFMDVETNLYLDQSVFIEIPIVVTRRLKTSCQLPRDETLVLAWPDISHPSELMVAFLRLETMDNPESELLSCK